MESLPVEIKFAQNLAGNETKTRLKAVKKLRKYLKVKSASKKDGFSLEDFLKLWKGLHYCMWMQDKPLLQEELSTTLTNLVHDLSTHEAQLMFIKVFFITEAREWNSIDIWRLDKFMMMVRNMLYESLMVMKKLKWDKNKLEGLTEMFYDTIMNPDSDTTPDGLKIHFCDIYLEEVEKAGDSQLTSSQLLQLLVPFIKFMKKAKNGTLLMRVSSCVFDPIVTRLGNEIQLQQTQNTDGEETEETDDIPFLSLKFDGKLISDHIFLVSQEDDMLIRNRPVLYGIVKKLQDVQEGVLPQQKKAAVSQGVTGHDVRHAVNTLMNLDGKKDRKKNRKKKNKKDKHSEDSGVNENADPNGDDGNNLETNEIPSTSHIGGKRKHAATDDSEPLTKVKKKKLEPESKSEDTEKKTFKKLKNKFSKGKKEKKLVTENQSEMETQSKKKTKSNSISKPVSETASMPVQKTETGKNEVSKTKNRNNTKEIIVTAEVPSSMKKSTDKKSPDTLKKKGKRMHSQSEDSSIKNVQVFTPSSAIKVPDIVVQGPTPIVKSQATKSPVPVTNGDLQEGEIEIWVPNKKYKGNKDMTTPKSNIAAFDNTKPPMAFVKRSLSKSLKRTPSSLKTPSSSNQTGSSKRVSFDMKKNKAQGFKESLNSPLTPYNPAKQPDSGILKSPASATPGQGSSIVAAKYSNSTSETPIIRQATARVVAKKKGMATPVVSLGFQKKKATPITRKRAADFFL